MNMTTRATCLFTPSSASVHFTIHSNTFRSISYKASSLSLPSGRRRRHSSSRLPHHPHHDLRVIDPLRILHPLDILLDPRRPPLMPLDHLHPRPHPCLVLLAPLPLLALALRALLRSRLTRIRLGADVPLPSPVLVRGP